MEVKPEELSQLIQLAGISHQPEQEPVAVAISAEDNISDCNCSNTSTMRGLLDALNVDEPEIEEEIEEETEWENASRDFSKSAHPVQNNYDDFSYHPAKNHMQRRTNGYGDNPLREEELIKEYTEFKKKD